MNTARPPDRPKLPPRRPARPVVPERRPFRDNPRLILAGIALLLLSLIAIIQLSARTTRLNPDFMRAPTTDAPAEACGADGPKSGAQPFDAILAASPSNSPRRMSSRFLRAGSFDASS